MDPSSCRERGIAHEQEDPRSILSEWGYWGEELIGPLETFDEAGYDVDFATPTGKRPGRAPPEHGPRLRRPAARPLRHHAGDGREGDGDRRRRPRLDNPISLKRAAPRAARTTARRTSSASRRPTTRSSTESAKELVDKYDAMLHRRRQRADRRPREQPARARPDPRASTDADKPIAAECYGVTCLAFARDREDRKSIISGKHVTGHCIEYDYKDGTGFMGTDFNMGPPPYPLEYILRDATAPGGAYHGNFGHETSVIVDYPFITGPLDAGLVPDRAEDGRGARERPARSGASIRARPAPRPERHDGGTARRAASRSSSSSSPTGSRTCSATPARSSRASSTRSASYPELQYVSTLQETIAVAMADGYARATQRPTRRAAPQRRRARQRDRHDVPGEARPRAARRDRRRVGRPVRRDGRADGRRPRRDGEAGDQVVDARGRPVVAAARAAAGDQDRRDAADGARLRRLPMDVLDAPARGGGRADVVPGHARRADRRGRRARGGDCSPAPRGRSSIIGDGVALLGRPGGARPASPSCSAPRCGARTRPRSTSPPTHPLYRGQLGHMFGEHSRGITSQADAVLIVGTYVFPEVFPALEGVFAHGAQVVHIDLNAYEIAKNFPVDLGLVGRPEADARPRSPTRSSATLTPSSARPRARRAGDARRAEARGARGRTSARPRVRRRRAAARRRRSWRSSRGRRPTTSIIFDEALTVSPELTRHLPPTLPGHFFQTRGGSLGVGIPGAIGRQARPPGQDGDRLHRRRRRMYTIQALWTAAHHDIDAKFVICNNRSYQLLKLNMQQYWRERGLPEHALPGSLRPRRARRSASTSSRARMGVPAARVETPDEIGARDRRGARRTTARS